MNTTVRFIIRLAIVIAMPFFLGLTNIRLIISPAYPRMEYAKASFPEDSFGFSQEQRLDLALVAVDYLGRREAAEEVIYLLEEQVIPGTEEPLYNEREIGHMVDVKHVTDGIKQVGAAAAAIVFLGLALLLWQPATRREGYRAILNGGIATTTILFALALFILVAWSVFFTQFHELLFPPGTWTFYFSDSLIRLFPEKFWFDLGVILSVGTLVEGVIVAALGYWLLRRDLLRIED
ncbi:MAG: TIGR01906 family membrane protein [Chloroflexi bacterium]|nr:TIGR01906 family membrane protein [Chloroflexota bacterium]MBP8055311.1 TIGR01906 family membrane protein [Chloroflexota bacterium]